MTESEVISLIASITESGAWVLVVYLLLSDRNKLAQMTQRFLDHLEQEAALKRVEQASRRKPTGT